MLGSGGWGGVRFASRPLGLTDPYRAGFHRGLACVPSLCRERVHVVKWALHSHAAGSSRSPSCEPGQLGCSPVTAKKISRLWRCRDGARIGTPPTASYCTSEATPRAGGALRGLDDVSGSLMGAGARVIKVQLDQRSDKQDENVNKRSNPGRDGTRPVGATEPRTSGQKRIPTRT